jgi:hypothetical protein
VSVTHPTRRQRGARLAATVARVFDWIEDPELRRETGQELNKGESRNSLARAVFIHRLGGVVHFWPFWGNKRARGNGRPLRVDLGQRHMRGSLWISFPRVHARQRRREARCRSECSRDRSCQSDPPAECDNPFPYGPRTRLSAAHDWIESRPGYARYRCPDRAPPP